VVVRLLEACDGLVVLATSRERLQVSPERVVPAVSLRFGGPPAVTFLAPRPRCAERHALRDTP